MFILGCRTLYVYVVALILAEIELHHQRLNKKITMKKVLPLAIIALLSSALNAQVRQIVANKGLESSGGIPFNNNKIMLVSKLDSTAWVTDGTSVGSFQLSSSIKYDGNSSGLLNGKVIFSGSTPSTGQELFISDGTVVGTGLLKDINPGSDSSSANNFVLMNGILYFTAFTAAEGRELWRTDGTPNGTTLVKDVVPGRSSSDTTSNYHLFSTGSYLLLSAPTPSSGMELWGSDGTNNGTKLLKDINPGASSSNPANFSRYNNIVLFTATDLAHGNEIWKTDGTSNGTMLLKDIYPGVKSSVSFLESLGLSVFNGRFYFAANDSTHGSELWSTDGTTQNTAMVKDIEPGPMSGVPFFYSPLPVGNKMIFSASTTTNGFELWQTDGTEAGTQLFKDILPGPRSSYASILPPYLFDLNAQTVYYGLFQGNKFFFEADDSLHGRELWISDGTPGGTMMTKDIYPGTGTSEISSYLYTSSALYFGANDSTYGKELWKSDGTSAGTSMVADINPTVQNSVPAGSNPSFLFFIVNQKVIFDASDGEGAGNDLYVLDGNFSSLPLKLGDFTVTPKNRDALLQWFTLSEENTRDFTIQRSDDGSHFYNIGSVDAEGTSSFTKTYYFTDGGIIISGKDIVYYRLISADVDGKKEISKVVSLKLNTSQWAAKLISNPVHSNLDIIFTGSAANVKVSIIDITGKTLSSSITPANGHITLPSSQLRSGTYFLTAEKNNDRRVIKFIKQ